MSKESIFSDLNNLEVVTTTSGKYEEAFGFTQEEVFTALDTYGYGEKKEEVKYWYDGFVFGNKSDIYNPWSILNFLEKGNESAIWSLLLASGYLKVLGYEKLEEVPLIRKPLYDLSLTNLEVHRMFFDIVHDWFHKAEADYNDFEEALLLGNLDAMNEYMNLVSMQIFSSFDTGCSPSALQPERFYHGFVLGLIVDLSDTYIITSNRESGFGRYDVMLEPKDKNTDAYILEFKVFPPLYNF